MKRIMLTIGAAFAALSFCATAQVPDDSKNLADAVLASAGTAKYDAIKDCLGAKSDTSQVACFMAVTMIQRDETNQAALAKASQPVFVGAPPAPAPSIEAPCSGIVGCVFAAVGKGLQKIGDFAERNAVPLGQVYSNQRIALRQAAASEKQYEYRRDTDLAAYSALQNLGVAGINGTRDTAAAGFTALGRLPPAVQTTYQLNNAQGIQFGNGQLLWQSQNPTNPAPRVCSVDATGVLTCVP